MGPIEQTLARQSYQMRLPLPDKIANAPELFNGLEIYLQAFFDLDTERSHSMGVTMIPWNAIKSYAVAYEFSSDQTDDLIHFIRKMDIAHTTKIQNRAKANAAQSS